MSQSLVNWKPCYRIIPTKYPPVSIYKQVSSDDEFEILAALESQTNPRIKNQIDSISEKQSIYEPGTGSDAGPGVETGVGYIMAAFTHWNPEGSRFSDGSYGVYYTAKNLETAILETKYHQENFYRCTENNKKLSLDMRVLTAELNCYLKDLRNSPDKSLFTNDYSTPQKYAKDLQEKDSNGIVYMSVRHSGYEAAAVFKPEALSNCRSENIYLVYEWNGCEINSIYEKKIYF